MAVADVDYNASAKDTLSLKYYYQHDPTLAPYSYSSVPGFTEHLDSGAQVASIINTLVLKPNLSTTQTLGILREKNWADNEQPFGPDSIPGGAAGTGSINMFGSKYFPGVSIYNVLGQYQPSGVSRYTSISAPTRKSQSTNTGMFQNRLAPSGNAIWILGKHTISFGANYTYTQLNTIDKRTGTGTIATDDLSQFMQGRFSRQRVHRLLCHLVPAGQRQPLLSRQSAGNLRARQVPSHPDAFTHRRRPLRLGRRPHREVRPPLQLRSHNPGSSLRTNQYCYNAASDTIVSPGLIIAGNNANGTKGVSNTTLTGRQWGIGPRVGAAWQPEIFHSKVVVRVGGGMYYDRGELFSYFSPGYAIGTVTGGPFGANQQLPFVNASTCPSATLYYYEGYLPTCGGTDAEGNLENPYGTSLQYAAPTNPKASDLSNFLPNACSIVNTGYSGVPNVCPVTSGTPNGEIINNGQPISLGVYDRANKLPYTMNYTLDIQWQPRNDLAIEVGYVGNLGRHQVIPVPFNQPNIASPSNPILSGGGCPQSYTYGFNLAYGSLPAGTPSCFGFPAGYHGNYEGGNVDLRVPYIGYAAESIDYKAAGVDDYNALQVHVDKRMSRGIQVGASYTWSHALDEQSGLGLFYNGNNPNKLRGAYGSADFDRTHVLNISYVFQLHDFAKESSLQGKFIDGWSLVGLTVMQSGQPYSVIDYSGAVGSIYYSTSDGITNPIVPLATGFTAKSATDGRIRRMDRLRQRTSPERQLLYSAAAPGRRPQWRHPTRRPV